MENNSFLNCRRIVLYIFIILWFIFLSDYVWYVTKVSAIFVRVFTVSLHFPYHMDLVFFLDVFPQTLIRHITINPVHSSVWKPNNSHVNLHLCMSWCNSVGLKKCKTFYFDQHKLLMSECFFLCNFFLPYIFLVDSFEEMQNFLFRST